MTTPLVSVTSVTPVSARSGIATPLTIGGTGFTSVTVTGVYIGHACSTVVVVSDTEITCVTPTGYVGTYEVGVATSTGGSSLPTGFTYYVQITLTRLTPSTGGISGGEDVDLYASGPTGFSFGVVVTFDGTEYRVTPTGGHPPGSLWYFDDGHVRIMGVPAHGPGEVTVTAQNPTSSVSNALTYTYTDTTPPDTTPPTVTSVTPSSGTKAGGTPVTVTGTGFTTVSEVRFGTEPLRTLVVVSDTEITGVTHSHPYGLVSVVVSTSHGTGTGLLYTYTTPTAGTFTRIAPTRGFVGGTGFFTIYGTGLTHVIRVIFGGVTATTVVVSTTGTKVTGKYPAHAAGLVSVEMITSSGPTVECGTVFTYQTTPTPHATSVVPARGNFAGGTAVTLHGVNFVDVTSVTFGTTNPATTVVTVSDTEITCKTPSHEPGTVEVIVTSSTLGKGTTGAFFTFVATPIVTSIYPATGSATGGTSVTIHGSNFRDATRVQFGSGYATDIYVYEGGTALTCTTPPHPPGTVAVAVYTTVGSGTKDDAFTYLTPETTLETWQFLINGLLLGADTVYDVVQPVDGFDLPGVRTGDVGQPRMHGQLAGLDLLAGRDMTIPLEVVADDYDLQHSLDALFAAIDMQDVFGRPQVQEVPLYFKVPNEPVRHVNVRLRGRKMPIDIAYSVGNMASVLLAFHATDPRMYGQPVVTSGVVGDQLSFNNIGNFDTAPIITITGPCVTPFIIAAPGSDGLFRFGVPGWDTLTGPGVLYPNGTTPSPSLTFALTVPEGQQLVIDVAAHTAVLNGENVLGSQLPGSWWFWLPPGNTQVLFSAETYGEGNAVSVAWAPAWV